MAEIVPISNASPLIILSRAQRLNLLRLESEHVSVPLAVADELRQRGPSDPAVRALQETPWLEVIEVYRVPEHILALRLGRGESEVLTWAARHPGSVAILDDLRARHAAAALDIPTRGVLGFGLVAKQRGVLPLARPVLEELRHAGPYLSDHALNLALL